jgi:phosphoglycerol transferase MdoB-like AlkP superfamily enzyme
MPYALAFTLEGRAPRLVVTSREIAVPLVVANTGSRVWDQRTVHLSYHWLWLVPRELVRRSRWDVPYHDGIRTDLPARVAPGAQAPVEGRLLAPSIPGLYWLQWDMVEEGVAWFAQQSPRQPRQLVVVMPSAAGLFAPLPLAIALAGLIALMRIERGRPASASVAGIVAVSDVAWCASTLVAKELALVPAALLEPTAVAYWLTVVAAVAVPALAMLVLPRRIRIWTLYALGVLGSLLILADIVYYRFFGDVISAPAALAAQQTGRVLGSVRSLLTPELWWLVIDLPVAFVLMVALHRSVVLRGLPRRRERAAGAGVLAGLALVGLMLSAPRVLASSALDQTFRDRALVEQLGPFGYHAYDIWSYARATLLRPRATAAQIDEARAWFADRAPLRRGSGGTFGAARGRNLIVIQVESLQDFAVEYRVGGQEVMPNLRRWTADSIRFTNVSDQTSEGRTSDAEFAAMASLLPLDHGAVAFRYPANHYVALPRVLADHGYTTLSAVPFEPGFWNRRVMHPSYGFQQTLFEPDFTLTEQIGWGLNDRDFLQQMVPRLEALHEPFCAWLITLSLHHPFDDFPAAHKELTLGPLEGTSFGNYLHTMRFFDRALGEFKSVLARRGLLERTLMVVFGDHDAGFARERAMARTIGIGTDEAAWALNDRVPLFIRVPAGGGGELTHEIARPAGQTDFAPTLLALLGIDPAPLPYVGRNLLGEPDDPPVLRPYGDWLDAAHIYLSHAGQRGSGCFDSTARAAVEPTLCSDTAARARKAREISRLVVVEDLQQRLR